MKKDDKIQKLDFSDEFLLDSVERRFQSGEYLAALTLLNRRNETYEPSADAAALGADIYEGMELWAQAAACWFVFLDTCNEADFAEGYEGLAVCFMNMGDDLQSALYFHQVYGNEDIVKLASEKTKPKLRLIHSEDGSSDDGAALDRGLFLLRMGELDKARRMLDEVSKNSPDYASAAGLSAMCTLMIGDEERAEKVCKELLETHPENIQALTTYIAVLQGRGKKEEAKEAARRLSNVEIKTTEDLFRISTALCETGLHAEAYEKLSLLIKRMPYDDTALFFYAVAAYNTKNNREAIEALERMTTVYPKKALARYYLVRMREIEDGGPRFKMNYFYKMPKEKYREIADFLLAADNLSENELWTVQNLPELTEIFRIAFDEMEGRDSKLQLLAVKVALRLHSDAFLREVLLEPSADEVVKLAIMHGLVMRNEEDSFGTVFLNVYREFFTHKIEVGGKRKKEFMAAFADVYSKFAFMNEGNEERIILAAEDIFASLTEEGASAYFRERESLAAAIYREARLPRAEREFSQIVQLFKANKFITQEILDFMI